MKPAVEWAHELAAVGCSDWAAIVKRIQEDARKELLENNCQHTLACANHQRRVQECIAKFEAAYGDTDDESAPPHPMELPPGFLEALSDAVNGDADARPVGIRPLAVTRVSVLLTYGTDKIYCYLSAPTPFPEMKYEACATIDARAGYGVEWCRLILGVEPKVIDTRCGSDDKKES